LGQSEWANQLLEPHNKVLYIHTLKGLRFQTIDEIQENAIGEQRAITQNALQEAFKQWTKYWERFIASRGDYIEGDSVSNAVK
jgi:hypothetical protein